MKYIKRVILENFQSHKYTVMDFDEGLNVIVGQSDSGKTAILRGIKWAIFNEPSGDFFIREGERECSVTIVFSHGIKVKRSRTKSKNTYILYDNEGKEMVFEGFGLKVPEEITEAIGIDKVLLDSNLSKSINMGDQLEGPFLLSEMSSTKSNAIGRLVGVDIIDDTLRETLKDNKNLNTSKKQTEELLIYLDKEIESFAYLDDYNKRLEKIEANIKLIDDKEKSIKIYVDLMDKYTSLSLEKKATLNILDKLTDLSKIENILLRLEKNVVLLDRLSITYDKLSLIRKDILQDTDLLKKTKDLNKADLRINEIVEKVDGFRKLKDIRDKVENNKKDIKCLSNNLLLYKETDLAQEKLLKAEGLLSSLNNIKNLNTNYSEVQLSKGKGQVYLNKFKDVDKIKLDGLEEKIKKLEKIKALADKLGKEIENKNKQVEELKFIDKEVKIESGKYEQFLINSKFCPICDTELSGKKIDKIMKKYI